MPSARSVTAFRMRGTRPVRSTEAARSNPVYHSGGWDYVYADGMRQNNGRALKVDEGLSLAATQRGAACYVVEVCTNCNWNHLSEAFRARTAG